MSRELPLYPRGLRIRHIVLAPAAPPRAPTKAQSERTPHVETGAQSSGAIGAGAGTRRAARRGAPRAQPRAPSSVATARRAYPETWRPRRLAATTRPWRSRSERVSMKAKLRRRWREQAQRCPEEWFDFEPGLVAMKAGERARDCTRGKSHVGQGRPYLRENVRVRRRSSSFL